MFKTANKGDFDRAPYIKIPLGNGKPFSGEYETIKQIGKDVGKEMEPIIKVLARNNTPRNRGVEKLTFEEWWTSKDARDFKIYFNDRTLFLPLE